MLHIIKTNTSTIFVSTEALKGRNVVPSRLGVCLKIVMLVTELNQICSYLHTSIFVLSNDYGSCGLINSWIYKADIYK